MVKWSVSSIFVIFIAVQPYFLWFFCLRRIRYNLFNKNSSDNSRHTLSIRRRKTTKYYHTNTRPLPLPFLLPPLDITNPFLFSRTEEWKTKQYTIPERRHPTQTYTIPVLKVLLGLHCEKCEWVRIGFFEFVVLQEHKFHLRKTQSFISFIR